MRHTPEPLGKLEWLLLFVTLSVMPWVISGVMHYTFGIERVLAMSGGVDFLLVWLNVVLILSIFSSRLSKKNIRYSLVATITVGITWTLTLMPSEPLQIALAMLIVIGLLRLFFDKLSAFRVGVPIMVLGVLTVAVVHHVLFIYQTHKPDTLEMQNQLEKVVSVDHKNWNNGPCEVDGWHFDQCLRFPGQFIGTYTGQAHLKPVIESMQTEFKSTGDKVVSGVAQDIDRAPHWALSYDGTHWQIVYWENGYYEFVTFTLMVWLWVIAVTVWSLTWLVLIHWHQTTSAKDRKNSVRKVSGWIFGVFVLHVAHLQALSFCLPGLIPNAAMTHPNQWETLTPQIQGFLQDMVLWSVLGWSVVVLIIVVGHLALFRIRRTKRNLR